MVVFNMVNILDYEIDYTILFIFGLIINSKVLRASSVIGVIFRKIKSICAGGYK